MDCNIGHKIFLLHNSCMQAFLGILNHNEMQASPILQYHKNYSVAPKFYKLCDMRSHSYVCSYLFVNDLQNKNGKKVQNDGANRWILEI